MSGFSDDQLLLQRFYKHCKERPGDIYMHQPHGGGQVTPYTWGEVLEKARRLASHLASKGWEPQSKIAMISKNCAQFIIADLAIWMAGHVSVALYPTLNADTVAYILEHSDAKMVFVGKLDTWNEVQKGVPAELPAIAFPNAPATDYPKWDDILAASEPIEGHPVRDADDEALIIYTSGSTGQPKGVLHSFRTISVPTVGLVEALNVTTADRGLSYLPLAHGMDRWLSECLSLYAGSQLFFAESLHSFVADLKRAQPTLFVSVPRLWLKFQLGVFAKMPKEKLDKIFRIPILRRIVKKKILGNLGLAASQNMTSFLIAAAVMGGSQGGFMTLTAVIIQSIVPDSIRGRVSSIYLMHIGGMMALFNLANGRLADAFGVATVLAVTASAFLGCLAVSLGLAPLRALFFTGSRTALGPQAA